MNDIFISYAHMDDQVLDEDQKGWITKFHRVLRVKLGQLMGEPAKIWRDEKLSGTDVYDDKIVSEFKKAKVMISVLSPRYIKSEWCNRELNEFYEAAENESGIRVGEKSRLIKVVKTPFDTDQAAEHLPKIFEAILGFDFFEQDPESGRIVEFDEAFGVKAKQNYYSRIYDLASEIADILKRMEGGSSSVPQTEPLAKTGKTVYLAAVTSDIQSGREKLLRELTDRGHRVLPDRPLPNTGQELMEAIGDLLRQSDCSIHMVGQKYGMIPEDSAHSIAKLQNDLATERIESHPEFHRFIWMPHAILTDDDRQHQFITELREDPRAHAGAELMEDSLDHFRDYVVEKLKPKPKSKTLSSLTSSSVEASGNPAVYLIYDMKDDEVVAPLEDYLFDQGLEVMLPTFDGEEADIKQAHIEKMIHCDAVLIYYGQADRSWVDMKLMNLMKAPGYGKETPFKAKTVYLAPPMDRRKQRYRTHSAEVVVQESEAFEPSLLDSFVSTLKS
ncbi:MAG: TIR domain-containing protein [Limisphaerales bacterium]|nr:toll/interleukin-1 receptor domain-containing protein [Verrucomicrobiota bacterium]